MNFTHVYAQIRADLAPVLVDVENPSTGVPSFGTPLEELNLRYPGMTRISYEEYEAAVVTCFCKDPVEITSEQWDEALCVLPPMHWTNGRHAESFMCSEFLTGCLTACYVRLGDKHWTMTRKCSTPHDSLVQDVLAWLEKEVVAVPV